jgi:SAM-dependent MidA family methyltransferase
MLPLPEPVLQARSKQLTDIITDEVNANHGWIGFDRFMHSVLYYPDLGYYSGTLEKFGRDGDFITAPLMGDLFARCIARQCAQILKLTEGLDIYEFGAGSGALAGDTLLELDRLDQLPQHYYILETSAELRQRQRDHFTSLPEKISCRICWLEQIPPVLNGVVLANELLDALPCKRFEIDIHGQARELGVSMVRDQFQWATGPAIAPQAMDFESMDLATGYQSELPLQAGAWVNTIGRALQTGVILLIDYGFPGLEFYHPDRNQGTLMCHYRHHAHPDPFFWPGLQDITTHIDFSAIARVAAMGGLEVAGYCDQANFLISLGLLDFLGESVHSNELESRKMLELSAQV